MSHAHSNVVALKSRNLLEPTDPANDAGMNVDLDTDNRDLSNSSLPSDHQGEELGELLRRIATDRNKAAFHIFFKEFAPKIKSYAIKQGMLEHGDALVLEVRVIIWCRASQFDSSKASATTWVYAITRNARIDMLRKFGRSSVETSFDSEHLWSIPGTDEPAGNWQDGVIAAKVRKSLDVLPNEQKDVIAKVYLEDKSHQRVADEMGLPLGTVKSRVRLALQKLNVALDGKVEINN